MKTTDKPIIVEQTFNTTINKVWGAITRLDEMKQWFFGDIDLFQPEVGFETQFKVRVEDRVFTHLWKITEVIPLKKINYNWKYKEYPGDSFVTFELHEEKNHVNLRLITTVLEDFPSDIPEFTRESCTAGWKYFIQKNLKEYLDLK